MEPEQLRRGKLFHRRVQAEWTDGPIENSSARKEHRIRLEALTGNGTRIRHGRIDIFIDQIDDFVSVIEIKATNWDAVKPAKRRRLLGSHRRQVLRYVDTYLDRDKISVCAAIIYPQAPVNPELKEEVESYLNAHALQVLWFDDQ